MFYTTESLKIRIPIYEIYIVDRDLHLLTVNTRLEYKWSQFQIADINRKIISKLLYINEK